MRYSILVCICLLLTCPLIVLKRRFSDQNGAKLGHFKKKQKNSGTFVTKSPLGALLI